MGGAFSWLVDLFQSKEMEVVLLGLQNGACARGPSAAAGKTTLLNALSGGRPVETAPTVGLGVKSVKAGSVRLKCWDVGGQRQYRSEWARYAAGCHCILYVVDVSAPDTIPEARKELHRLLEDRALASTPICVCANKVDVEPHLSERDVIAGLNLDYIIDQPWVVVPISAKHGNNINEVLQWLVKQAPDG